ncbi:MAG TPA: GtrA family protein [Candidatus Saccharimonadales bacterium]|nr:GtrA family protein [Candidatus Saccharimonadales bacterium]
MHAILPQIGKFGIVGVLNTVIDFSIFNFLTGRLRVAKIVANICSTTVAMVFSFVANRDAVFHAGSGNPLDQAILFFIATGFGLYVLQTGVFYLLLHRWQWPYQVAVWTVDLRRFPKRISTDVVHRNGVKICGTIVSLIWNFILYKYVVFR